MSVAESRVGRLPVRTMLLVAAVVWFVLLGGTELGQVHTAIRTINAVIAAAIIGLWLWRLPKRADTADILLLGALLAFLAACVVSTFPRLSLDAATTAMAFTAACSVARWEVSDARAGRALVTTLAFCGLGLILVFVGLWGSIWLEWFDVEGSIPPLDLLLPVGPYRGYHVVGMLFALLLPAMLLLARRRGIGVVGWVGAALSLLLIYMSGSRTVWLALGIVAAAWLAWAFVRDRRIAVLAGAIVFGVLLVLGVRGSLPDLMARLTTSGTLDLRAQIWQQSLSTWLAHPLTGTGPGSFSQAFTLGDYFVTVDRVGRHADSAIIQILMEAGALGLATVVALCAATVVGVYRAGDRSNPMAVAGLGLFVLMSFTDNPSDTAFLVVIAICWFALAAPSVDVPERAWTPSWRTAGIAVTAVVVVVAVASSLAAAAAFDASQAAARAGNQGATLDQLDTAVALDPGQALYWRERGMHRAASGDTDGATDDLRAALRLNPADTPAMRALAYLRADAGDADEALDLARRAAELRPTAEENLTTLALVAVRVGDNDASRAALVEALRRTPWIAASPQWQATFPTGSELQALLASAHDAWTGRTDGERFALSQVWLAAVDGDGGEATLVERGWDIPSLLAADALLRCDLDAAEQSYAGAPLSRSADEQSLMVALLVGRAADASSLEETAAELSDLRNAAFESLISEEPAPSSPFWEPDEDRRLYERNPVVPADLGVQLPTAAEGLGAWLRDPIAAARISAPGSALSSCDAP